MSLSHPFYVTRALSTTMFVVVMFLLGGCSASKEGIHIEFLSPACITPFKNYQYLTCDRIDFTIEEDAYYIPADFETDLASIPRIIWPIMAPSHSSLIKPAIVHDWFYRKSCDFTRYQSDLIFYYMLRQEGVTPLKASAMFYAVRWFGWSSYNKDYCDEEFKGLD